MRYFLTTVRRGTTTLLAITIMLGTTNHLQEEAVQDNSIRPVATSHPLESTLKRHGLMTRLMDLKGTTPTIISSTRTTKTGGRRRPSSRVLARATTTTKTPATITIKSPIKAEIETSRTEKSRITLSPLEKIASNRARTPTTTLRRDITQGQQAVLATRRPTRHQVPVFS